MPHDLHSRAGRGSALGEQGGEGLAERVKIDTPLLIVGLGNASCLEVLPEHSHFGDAVRPENSVRGLPGECRVSAGVICDNQMTDSGAKAILFGWKASSVAAKSIGISETYISGPRYV